MFKKPVFFLAIGLATLLFSCQKDYIENKVPLVNAGPAQTITADTDSVTLSGSATDEDGKVVAYLWSLVSGPSDVIITNPGSTTTFASKFMNGTYVFQLMATDEKGATGVDTVSVTLNRPTIKTLELQGGNTEELQFVLWGSTNYPANTGFPDISLIAWTKEGPIYNVRHLIKFDLSSIPANATITSANLYLYSMPAPLSAGNYVDANYGTDNSFVIKQITSNWSASSITYSTPPVTTTTNQVVIPTTSQTMLDLNLDVKASIQSMVTGNANYGFLLKLQNENAYTSRVFVSSINTNYTTKRPKLVVVYKK
jgi:hypothetical protein